MGYEIERKFLVVGDGWCGEAEGIELRQGYLSRDPERVVRVRAAGARAFVTIKGINRGASRCEYEYEIPVDDAGEMLRELCVSPIIEKTRYRHEHEGHIWEVDVFAGANQGLVLAEIELGSEEEVFARPAWVGQEVTGDVRYYNSNLAVRPFGSW